MTGAVKTSEDIARDVRLFLQSGGKLVQEPPGATGIDAKSGRPIVQKDNASYFVINTQGHSGVK